MTRPDTIHPGLDDHYEPEAPGYVPSTVELALMVLVGLSVGFILGSLMFAAIMLGATT